MYYLQQQPKNILPILNTLINICLGFQIAIKFALNLYIIIALALTIVTSIIIVYTYYDNVAQINKKNIFTYWATLIAFLCIKYDKVLNKVLLLIHKYNTKLFIVLINVIFIIRGYLHVFVMKIINNLFNIIIYIIIFKLLYTYSKRIIVKNKGNKLYDNMKYLMDVIYYICRVVLIICLNIIVFSVCLLLTLVVYHHAKNGEARAEIELDEITNYTIIE